MTLNARGTPHFFVNGFRLSGAQPFEKFQEVIDAQLSKARSIAARGIAKDKVYDEIMKEGKEPPPPEKKSVAAPTKDNPVKGLANAKVTIHSATSNGHFASELNQLSSRLQTSTKTRSSSSGATCRCRSDQDAPLAAEAAMEVFAQKGSAGFWKYHDMLFDAQGTDNGSNARTWKS